MDPEHVALARCARVAGQIISRIVKGADGLTSFQRAFQSTSHPRATPSALEEKILKLGREQEEDPDHRQVFGRYLLGHHRIFRGVHCGHAWWWCAELSKDGLVKTLQIQSFSTASVEHPGDCCQMTNHANPESQESNRHELMYVLCKRIFILQSARSHLSHIACTSGILVELARYGYTLDALVVKQPRLRDFRVIKRNSAERESLKPCLQILSSVYESEMRRKECHVQLLMQNQT